MYYVIQHSKLTSVLIGYLQTLMQLRISHSPFCTQMSSSFLLGWLAPFGKQHLLQNRHKERFRSVQCSLPVVPLSWTLQKRASTSKYFENTMKFTNNNREQDLAAAQFMQITYSSLVFSPCYLLPDMTALRNKHIIYKISHQMIWPQLTHPKWMRHESFGWPWHYAKPPTMMPITYSR